MIRPAPAESGWGFSRAAALSGPRCQPARHAALAPGAPGRGSPAAAEAGGGCLTCLRSLIDDQRECAIAALGVAYRREFELARRFERINEGETVSPAEVTGRSTSATTRRRCSGSGRKEARSQRGSAPQRSWLNALTRGRGGR